MTSVPDNDQHPGRESLSQSFRVYILGMFLLKALGFVRGIVFARLLGPEQYGKFILLFGIIAICEPIFVLGIPAVYMRFAPRYEMSNSLRPFFIRLFLIAVSGTVIGCGMIILFSDHIAAQILHNEEFATSLLIVGLSIIPFGMFHLIYTAFQGLRKYLQSVTVQIGQMILFLGGGAVLILMFKNYKAAILSFTIACTVVSLFVLFFIASRYLRKSESNVPGKAKKLYQTTLRFGFWVLLVDTGYELFRYVDKFFVNGMLSAADVGIYTVAFTLAGPLFFVGTIVGETLMPHISNSFDRGRKEEAISTINAFVKVSFLILANVIAVLACFRVPLVTLLYGSPYAGSAELLPIFLIYFAVFSIHMIFMLYAYLLEKPFFGFVAVFCGVGVICAGNLILIPILGLVGAACCSAVGGVVMLSVNLLLVRRYGFKVDARIIILFAAIVVGAFGTVWTMLLVLAANILLLRQNVVFNKNEREMIVNIARDFKKFAKRDGEQ